MTLQEIENLELDIVRLYLISRLLSNDIASLPSGESAVVDYEPLQLHNDLTMPSEETLLAELETYKQELRVEEQARIEEETRRSELSVRIESLLDSDINGFFSSVVPNVSNPHKHLRDLIPQKDQDAEVRSLLK